MAVRRVALAPDEPGVLQPAGDLDEVAGVDAQARAQLALRGRSGVVQRRQDGEVPEAEAVLGHHRAHARADGPPDPGAVRAGCRTAQ
ncbi:hypothetical protein SAMN05443665_106125 [Actinomadura meyerae]|uniref:Uncharacterized protein n=1 Tax=Actinomadura meyerae TaxID=240840 RepID=A0A239P1T4_9ACTN|nr:hypothetical protein SAMN05443665_106125 [Actinomadura meyerae]